MDAILLDEITSAVREADDWFKKIGGSSRHWVDDCFLPMLKKRGIDIFKAQEVYDCESRLATVDVERDRLLEVVKLFYRKHVLNDESIGWDELGDKLYNELSEILGDKEFCKWLDTQSM